MNGYVAQRRGRFYAVIYDDAGRRRCNLRTPHPPRPTANASTVEQRRNARKTTA